MAKLLGGKERDWPHSPEHAWRRFEVSAKDRSTGQRSGIIRGKAGADRHRCAERPRSQQLVAYVLLFRGHAERRTAGLGSRRPFGCQFSVRQAEMIEDALRVVRLLRLIRLAACIVLVA
jgi:hypothetical protein